MQLKSLLVPSCFIGCHQVPDKAEVTLVDKGQAVGAVSSFGPVHQFEVEIAHGKHCFCFPKLNWLKINKMTNLCPHLDLHKKSNENNHIYRKCRPLLTRLGIYCPPYLYKFSSNCWTNLMKPYRVEITVQLWLLCSSFYFVQDAEVFYKV